MRPMFGRYSSTNNQFVLGYSEKGEGDDIDPDLIVISEEAHEWNIAHLIYDYICLSIPFRKTIDCKKLSPSPCDQEILKKIQNYGPSEDNSVWDVLKDF